MTDGGGTLTYRWAFGIVVAVLGALLAIGISDVRARIADCETRMSSHLETSSQGFQRIAVLEARVATLERQLEEERRRQ